MILRPRSADRRGETTGVMPRSRAPVAAVPLFVALFLCFPLPCRGQGIEKLIESGPVKVTLSLTPEAPKIGDLVALEIRVVAEKDVELLMPEFGEALERFAIVDFVPRESIDEDGRITSSQQYRLQPPSSGQQAIPPILIEYVDLREGEQQAPEGLDAYEILTEPLEFEVASVMPENASGELRPPLGRLEPLAPPPKPIWPWVVVALVVIAAATPLVVRAALNARRRRRQRSAYEVARWRLDQLLRQPRISNDEVDAFYVDLSNIVRRYLEDRFDLRAPELTTEEFLNSLQQSPDMSRDHQSLLREFLRQADLVKFARAEPSEQDIQNSINAAAQFLEETRDNAPMVDVDDESPLGPSLPAAEVAHG